MSHCPHVLEYQSAIDILADSWEREAAAESAKAWCSSRSACRADALWACAAELRQTIKSAAVSTALPNRQTEGS